MSWIQVTILCPADYEQELEDLFRHTPVCCFHSSKVGGYCGHPNFYSEDWKGAQIKLESVLDQQDWPLLKERIETLKRKGLLTEGVVLTKNIEGFISLQDKSTLENGDD